MFFVSCVEDYLVSWNRFLDVPWIGFTHNTPTHPELTRRTHPHTPDLKRMLESKNWQVNSQHCVGLFCLSRYAYDYIRPRTRVPMSVVFHPTETPSVKFDWSRFERNQNKLLVLVGHWLRRFQDIYDIRSPFRKAILKGTDAEYDKLDGMMVKENRQEVEFLPRVSNDEFDRLVTQNIVFAPLYDASANNTIIECIVRNTPVLVNKLSSVIEYLGEGYPLFYTSIEEAEAKLRDVDLLRSTYEYLLVKDKSFLSATHFLESVKTSDVYRNRHLGQVKVRFL